MDKGSCNVVVTGDLTGEMEPEQAKNHLCKSFGCDRAVADILVGGQAVVIKKNVSRAVAMQYATVLREAGVVCEIEDAAELEAEPTRPGSGEERPAAPVVGTPPVVCPNCGHAGSSPEECVKCGIIYARYRQAKVPETGADDSFSISTGKGREKGTPFKLLLLLVVLGLGVYFIRFKGEVRHPPGILVDSEPTQIIGRSSQSWVKGTKTVVPLARFRIKARVLSTERYRFGEQAELCPLDLALGWGIMSDQRMLDKLVIAQGNRRYALEPLDPNVRLPWAEIMSHSSNVHIIPANEEIEEAVFRFRPGDIVELQGYLVGVKENGQWVWFSSLSRTDLGDGACEIFWVERAAVR